MAINTTPGAGSVIDSIIIEDLLFNPAEGEEADYQKRDLGMSARVIRFVSHTAYYLRRNPSMLPILFRGLQIILQVLHKLFRSRGCNQKFYEFVNSVISVLASTLVRSSEQRIVPALFSFLEMLPSAQLLYVLDVPLRCFMKPRGMC